MKRYTNKNKKDKSKNNNNLKKRIKRVGENLFLGVAGTLLIIAPELYEHKQVENIEESAKLEEAIRSFKNIDKNKIGKYLSGEIENLYKKYPNLDDLILYSSPETQDIEFIDDIYRLYKGFIVDESKKEIENMDDVRVTQVDQIILQSDRITEGNKRIQETHKDQYKFITHRYLSAKFETKDGAELARIVYELLAQEIGLEENVQTSEQISHMIEEKGFYYDEKTKTFYTKDGKAYLVNVEKTAEEKVVEDEEIDR